MTWRTQATHAAETREVKEALKRAGLPAKSVRHGKGTAWGWLHVTLTRPANKHAVVVDSKIRHMTDAERRSLTVCLSCVGNCEACAKIREIESAVYSIVRQTTGRSGDYDGSTIIHWD